MRALTLTAVVRPDHTLIAQIPKDIPAGTRQVVVVLHDNDASPLEPTDRFTANWPIHQVGSVDPSLTFRREDIYGDDGRRTDFRGHEYFSVLHNGSVTISERRSRQVE